MQIFRSFFFCTALALIFQAGPSRAGEKDPLIGRWQVNDKSSSPSPTHNFTMDIVSCGKQLCGIWVDKGQCGRVVLKPGGGEGNSDAVFSPDKQAYLYIRPDLNEVFTVTLDLSIFGSSFRLYGDKERNLMRRTFPVEHIFQRIGPAECEPPATS